MRRVLLGLIVVLAAASPAGADTIGKKQSVDARIASLQTRVQASKEKEAALQGEIDAVSSKIRGLEQEVGDVSERLDPLVHELELREVKLNKLNTLFQVQTDRLGFLREEYATALQRLNHRLVAAYETETPDQLSVLLSSHSIGEMLDALEYIHLVAKRDREIADEFRRSRDEVAAARAHTKVARAEMNQQAKAVAVRVHQVRILRDELVAAKGQLDATRDRKKADLDSLSASERADAEEIDSLQQVSADLAAKIRAAQSHSTVTRAPSRAVSRSLRNRIAGVPPVSADV